MNRIALENIYSKGYFDYRSNKASDSEIDAMLAGVTVPLDENYLEFLKTLNGFAMNGLRFFGTKDQPAIHVLSAQNQNEFWSVEIPKLKDYFILADGDMEFYCYDPRDGKYYVLAKGGLARMGSFDDFDSMLDEMMSFYG